MTNPLEGIEKPFWQNDWQNIRFSTLDVIPSYAKLATSEFYSAFYKRLFETYQNYEELPSDWRAGKTQTALQLLKELPINSSVLSYGCGIGYVEKVLVEKRRDISITALDFSDVASQWIIRDVPFVRRISQINSSYKFDVVYLCQVLYSAPFAVCVEMLRDLATCLNDNGKIILINTSINLKENGDMLAEEARILDKPLKSFRSVLQALLRPLRRMQTKNNRQFWGWQRDNARYEAIIKAADLKVINSYAAAGQSFTIVSKSFEPFHRSSGKKVR